MHVDFFRGSKSDGGCDYVPYAEPSSNQLTGIRPKLLGLYVSHLPNSCATVLTVNRSQVLVTVSRNALTLGPHAKSALLFIHDYLESRLKLLRSVKVCACSSTLKVRKC